MYSMQELKTNWYELSGECTIRQGRHLTAKVNLCFTQAVDEHSLSVDGEELFAGKVADDVDLERADGRVPS